MSIYAIADEDTVLSLKLVGVDGQVVHTSAEAHEALQRILDRESIEIVLIDQTLAANFQQELGRLRMERIRPLLVEIPGESGFETSLSQLVQHAVGIPLGG